MTGRLDFALTLIAHLAGPEAATGPQLAFEYDPQPPTNCGSPDTAPQELTTALRQQLDDMAPGLTEFIAAQAG